MTNANFFLDLEGGNCQVQLENATYTNFSSWADGGGSSIVALNSSIVNTRNGLISDVPGATAVPGSNLFADVTCWITSINSNFATNLGSAFGYVDRTVVTSTSTNYTLGFANAGNIIEMNNAGANTVTVPSSATVNFPVGAKVTVVQAGAGATSPSTASGATIHGVGALAGQWKSAVLYKRAADEWVQLSGAF
jgi:hypothetical protein